MTAQYTAKSLVQAGYRAEAMPILGGDDLQNILRRTQNEKHPVTHVVICAMFIPTEWLAKLARQNPEVKFALNCHSNVGFLQAEPRAIKLMREAIDLEVGTSNFHAGGNNKRLIEILTDMYGQPLQYLPNLYYLHGKEPCHRPVWKGSLLKVGCFGSLRTYKNFSTAITAAIELSFQLRVPTEIWINSGRNDGNGSVVYDTAKAWTDNVPNVKLMEWPWSSWPEFKRHVGSMNILLQPSYTETFNNVTADGVAEGVPSVVSAAIEWCPDSWKAPSDSPKDVATVARRLLHDHHAPREGYEALVYYRRQGLEYWRMFLERA